MDESTIKNIVRLRLVVYTLGVRKGLWPSLEDAGAKEMMEYIFPKTGKIAFYNLVIESMKNKHAEFIPSGEYSIFKLPVQFEEEILSYLKANPNDDSLTPEDNPIEYLEALSTVTCSPSLGPVLIGAIKDSGIEYHKEVVA